MSRPISILAGPLSRARAARTLAVATLLAASGACKSDGIVAPVPDPDPVPVSTTSSSAGTITGTVTLGAGVAGSLSNARVAIYTSVVDRYYDRVVKQTALGGNGPTYSFSIADVAPGTYYMDICFLPVSDASCMNPNPDSPITVIAGRTSTVSVQIGR